VKVIWNFFLYMSLADAVGWIGNIFFVLGGILLARKKVSGFLSNGVGNICYIAQGIIVGTYSLWVLSIILTSINLYGVYNWRKNERRPT